MGNHQNESVEEASEEENEISSVHVEPSKKDEVDGTDHIEVIEINSKNSKLGSPTTKLSDRDKEAQKPEKLMTDNREKVNLTDVIEQEMSDNVPDSDPKMIEEESSVPEEYDDFMPGEPVTVRLTEVLNAMNTKIKLPDCLRHKYREDPFFKLILDEPGSYPNFEAIDGLLFLKLNEIEYYAYLI